MHPVIAFMSKTWLKIWQQLQPRMQMARSMKKQAPMKVIRKPVAMKKAPAMKLMKKKKPGRPISKYHGVFWCAKRKLWVAQRTFPEGHVPRQKFIYASKSEKECAEHFAKAMGKKLEEISISSP
jgi:hypothetical protein